MKKNRMLAIFLILCLLLCGCEPAGGSEESTAALPTDPKVEPKDVAFTCQNYDFDYFIGYSMTPVSFYILTREYVEVTDIAVTIPVEQGYDVYVFDDSTMNDYYQLAEIVKDPYGDLYASGEHDQMYLSWLYQTSRGMDWEEVGRKRLGWKQASDQYEKLLEDGLLSTPEGKAAIEELSAASEEYLTAKQAFLKEYSQLTPADLPTFYMYRVEIIFESDRNLPNSSFQEIQVDIAGESYTVPIGEIRLHNEWISDDPLNPLELVYSGPLDCITYPYHPGILKREGETYVAKKDVTLLGCELADTQTTVELLEIHLKIDDMDLIWDGETPIQIPRGKQVTFTYVIRDERLGELCYGGMFSPKVTFELEGQTYSMASSLSMQRRRLPPWVWYSACLQGMDLESYYRDYYYYSVDTEWKGYRS